MAGQLTKYAAYLRLSESSSFDICQKTILEQPQISAQLKELTEIIPRRDGKPLLSTDPYYYLQVSETKEAKDVLTQYYSIPGGSRKKVPIEAYCLAAGVSPLRILEIILQTAVRLEKQLHAAKSAIKAAQAQPELIDKHIFFGGKQEGFKDREFIAKVNGILPTGGPKVAVNVTQNATATAVVSAAPPPEQTIRRMVDRFNEKRTINTVAAPPQEDGAGLTTVPYDEEETGENE